MSEYQYYEFAATDRPRTAAEMAQLRKVFTRGQISTSGWRTVGQLRELARSASGLRLARESESRAAAAAERRLQREAVLRLLMADVDKRWAAVDALAARGSASGYTQAVRALADLAEAYALTSSPKAFDRALRRLLVRHATRGALLRRLTEAGLWSG